MKKVSLAVLLTFLLVLSIAAVAWAQPSSISVVRSSANNLYAMTCQGTTCTPFTQISGQFAQQPTLYWDEHLNSYVLIGVSTANSIWRSTFTYNGTFNNDWVQLPGSTPSPVAAVGGGSVNNSWHVQAATFTSITVPTTATNIIGDFVVCPFDGFAVANATGTIELNRSSATGYLYSYLAISDTTATLPASMSFAQTPPNTPLGTISMPFAVTATYSCPTGGGNKNLYLVAQCSDNANGTCDIFNQSMTWAYYPYAL